jgi:hypothetical protein
VSADPLAIHVPGKADFNLYAYVSGMALKATDPLGLQVAEGGTGQSGATPADLDSEQNQVPRAESEPAPGPGTGAEGTSGGGAGTYESPLVCESNFTPGAGGAADRFYGGVQGGGGLTQGGTPIPKPSQTPDAADIILSSPMGPEFAVAGVAGAARASSLAWKAAKEAELLGQLGRLERQVASDIKVLAGDTRGSIEIRIGAKPVQAGEAGRFSELESRGVVGDQLTPHHMPQAAAGYTSRAEGGALVLPHEEHVLTRTYGGAGRTVARAEKDMPFRQVLARDIRDIRSKLGTKYDEGLRNLLKYYRENVPELMQQR